MGNLCRQYFAAAIEIVDLYHARQPRWQLAVKLFAHDERDRRGWAKKLQRKLDPGKIEQRVAARRAFPAAQEERAQLLATEAGYWERNAERMRYPAFRKQGLFIGSGGIQAGCKTIIGQRLKQSGMFWTLRGANPILALRCAPLSGHFQDYWETALKPPIRQKYVAHPPATVPCADASMSREHAYGDLRTDCFAPLADSVTTGTAGDSPTERQVEDAGHTATRLREVQTGCRRNHQARARASTGN